MLGFKDSGTCRLICAQLFYASCVRLDSGISAFFTCKKEKSWLAESCGNVVQNSLQVKFKETMVGRDMRCIKQTAARSNKGTLHYFSPAFVLVASIVPYPISGHCNVRLFLLFPGNCGDSSPVCLQQETFVIYDLSNYEEVNVRCIMTLLLITCHIIIVCICLLNLDILIVS